MISCPSMGRLLSPLCECGIGSPTLSPVLFPGLEDLITFSAGVTRKVGLAGPKTS